MAEFATFVFTPAGLADASLAISACRAGAIGVLNAELRSDSVRILEEAKLIAGSVNSAFGIKLDSGAVLAAATLLPLTQRGLRWLLLDAEAIAGREDLVAEMRRAGVKVIAEVRTPQFRDLPLEQHADGLLLKGNESGGFVGEDSSFILLQKWLGQTTLPLYVRGGLTPHVAAACHAVGVAGGVLDAQVLLMEESRLPESLRSLLANLSGSETVAVGDGERGEYFRLLVRPGHTAARAFVTQGEGKGFDDLRGLVGAATMGWAETGKGLLPIGQDACFAAPWRKRYRHMAAVLRAIDDAVQGHLPAAVAAKPIFEGAPLAKALGLRLPVVQGPMTRVSDSAAFAAAVAEGGALPMVAFALLKGAPLEKLLVETKKLLHDRPWGIGLLGFAPQALLDEQLGCAAAFKPDYAIIAGGRPDQAVRLEAAGVPTFLHVPSANLIPLFLQEGARRFIFEGRECGGHIGPLSSFVLWSTMVDRLVAELAATKLAGSEVELLFAGGIHDAASSAMLQVLTAPLMALGVKVGILMGSAYLFTKEIVESGAIVPQFQQEVIDCERTVNLESGPGHASRCAYTPFAVDFFRTRVEHREQKMPADESRQKLDDLIMGRLRIASKGSTRRGLNAKLEKLSAEEQRAEGMYMLGQVATLRSQVTDVASLHRQVTTDAADLLAARMAAVSEPELAASQPPADIAIVGMGSVLPKANTTQAYWENILDKVDAITEIPSHRWDWRLYFDADRHARDKIYSKWGGFLDDMAFDPTRYGMPPKSIESVDPMQLMALEVARRTLEDAGYHEKAFDRERASVIVGASGGTGDVGSQYGLRSELPRFNGNLPADVADRLPEWTEDSFAGILLNVIAGRIANRLNFGGVNFTTDAACASSLAAIYQGVTELCGGRSDFVIAGGVDTVQGPFGYLCFSKTQALSPRGRCSTFDASGDGIVISEGIAMVALKRLADAQRDGDRIYAVIKGVGGSSDGNAKGMTAPLPAGQLRAMRRAYAQAGFGPETVGLFEAHGTGTVAGDTAELQSTTSLIKEGGGAPRQAVIGSVKTMIGHTKATAGVAGLIKAALALHTRVLPPHRGVNQPNAILQAPDSPVYLADEALPWLASGNTPRRAATSAFGFGGTNFHIVMEEYTAEYRHWMQPATTQHWPAELLMWSDADRPALIARLCDVQAQLTDEVVLRSLAASLANRWVRGAESVAIVAKNPAELATKLAMMLSFLRGELKALPPGLYHGRHAGAPGKLAVLFPGQGSQYPGMLREVALHFREGADALSSADAVLQTEFAQRFGAGKHLSHFIFPRGAYDDAAKAAAKEALTSTDVAQPALGAVEVALWRLVQSMGLQPDMLAGHSYGEFVALFAAGAIDFESLMRLSAARGRFIVDAAKSGGAELGTMAAVQAKREAVEEAIADIDGVVIANHNAPLQTIISGPHAGVKAAAVMLAKAQIDVTEIPVAAAFHSSLVRPAQAALAQMIDATDWQPCHVPVYSNTTARAHSADVAQTKRQMAEHLVRPVEFVAQIEAMYGDGARVFLEVGPKAVLSRLTSKILDTRAHAAIALDDGTGLPGLLNALGALVCAGVEIDPARLFEGRGCQLGDPATLDSVKRVVTVPKHAWMLNGSCARRAADPVRQMGVTVEQLAALPAPVAHAAEPATAPASVVAPPQPLTQPTAAVQRPPITPQPWSHKERKMEQRRPMPGGGDSAVMAEYFETMRQFLETQERVMTAFMGGDSVASARPLQRVQRSVQPLTLARAAEPVLEARPAAGVAPAAAVAARQPAPAKPAEAELIRVSPTPKAAPPAAAPHMNGTNGTNGTNGSHDAHAANGHASNGANGAAKPAAPAAAEISRDKMTDMLLAIVEEKTGYPRDMVGLDQTLESDLGIDSIKRIEVVGAMLQALPERYREALTASRSQLNTQATLNGMLNMMADVKPEGGVAVPFDVAETGTVAVQSRPSRHVIEASAQAMDAAALKQLTRGQFLVTEDAGGVAALLIERLQARGCTVTVVPRDVLGDESLLALWTAERRAEIANVAGVVHLAPMSAEWLAPDAPLEHWRAQLMRNEKSLFVLVHEFSDRLDAAAHVLSASALGGHFGRSKGAARGLSLQGGSVGMLKSLAEERPTLRVRGIDVDPARPAAEIADALMAEFELVGGRQEVGYPGGVRTVFRTVAAAVQPDEAQRKAPSPLVVLCTGGARGITAEVLRELAIPGNTLVLTGRSALAEEARELAALETADSIRAHFIAQVRSGASQLKPAEIQRKVQSVLAGREMRSNIADFEARGARVEYHAVDVTSQAQMGRLIGDIEARLGAIGGVVHGAGVIEDKLLADKTSDSWSRVVETKVLGLLLLQRHLKPESLRFLSVFSSVAGRYGNSGQSDYATANELMNRLCCQLRDQWGGQVNVSALCWGPWGATQFGAGMVTAQTEAKFAAKGVTLVSAQEGRRVFIEELARSAPAPSVEVVCGQGAWEEHEAARGATQTAPAVPQAGLVGPMLGAAVMSTLPMGEQVASVTIDARHVYLRQHRIDGVPVLPAAAAMALMADAARTLWPSWKVVEAREFRLTKGVEMKEPARTLQVVITPPPYGSSDGFEVAAALQSELANGRALVHYRCVLRLEQQVQGEFARNAATHSAKKMTLSQAYDEFLFHGPCFQVIESINGLSDGGSLSRVRPSRPTEWLAGVPAEHDQWVFDPALVDAAAQMALLWARTMRDQSCLPTRFGRVARLRDTLPPRMRMDFELVPIDDPYLVRANVYFIDDAGQVVMLIEDMECVASAALNRLGGTAGKLVEAASV
jgi:acyl transferase domain-containing protein/NAD(P)H-dependent flavin oxidoreductase YrpB (nitropropane dioxygenase family)/NADP-dependent 3-hydroxy acid dehydrogenase YdfG